MSKKNIEAYIPKALAVLEEKFPLGEIPSSFNGYISSFGASIVQSGLLPTLALFENTNTSTEENKEFLTYLIYRILTDTNDDSSLLLYVLKNNTSKTKQEILDISIAIKLSIRTFKKQLKREGQNG